MRRSERRTKAARLENTEGSEAARTRFRRALAQAGFFACVALATLTRLGPPAAAGADAPATEFSATRAFAHVAELAREPHAVGSTANARVRDYIARMLEQLGLRVELETEPSCTLVAGLRLSAPRAQSASAQ